MRTKILLTLLLPFVSQVLAAEPFTMVVLPDTQYYAKSYPDIFNKQTQWTVDNIDNHNIEFLVLVGDVVNDPAEAYQWVNADKAIDILDGDPAKFPQRRLPYSITIGNHDTDIMYDKYGGYQYFLKYFGPDRYKGCDWFKGHDRFGVNTYQIFEAVGRKWLHLSLEVYPGDEALQWAQGVLDQHPDLPAIYSTHAYIWDIEDQDTGLPRWSSTSKNSVGANYGLGQWYKFISTNDQIFMTLNGHHSDDDGAGLLVLDNIYGHKVYQMIQDYQSFSKGGDGWMRLLEFDEDNNAINVKTYSPTRNEYMTDQAQQFTLDINFNERFNSFSSRQATPAVQAANLLVTEYNSGNSRSDIKVEIPAGQSTDIISILDIQEGYGASNKGDYHVQIGSNAVDDVLNGVFMVSVAENGRTNGSNTLYYTSSIAYGNQPCWISVNSVANQQTGYSGGDEGNANVSVAYFPFENGWLGGHVTNMDDNKPIHGLLANYSLTLDENFEQAYGTASPTGELFQSEGCWLLKIPGVNSLTDGVLLVCAGKNEANFANAWPLNDGSGWSITVHDNATDGPNFECDPFCFVFVPFETQGIAAATIDGNGSTIEGTENFQMIKTSAGTYTLSIDNNSPATGALLLNCGTGIESCDNIISYQPQGNKWIIQVRDMPLASNTGLTSVSTHDNFSFVFIPFENPPVSPGPLRSTAPLPTSEITPVNAYDFEYTLEDSAGNNTPEMAGQDNYTDGIFGKAMVFTGRNQYATIDNTIRDSFTIEMWVKANNSASGDQWYQGVGLIDAEVSGPANDFGTSILNGKFAFGVGEPDKTIISQKSINDSKWHYCLATRNGITGRMSIYVDGHLEAQYYGPLEPKSSPQYITFGKIQTGDNYLNGQLDQVRIYNIELDEITVAEKYYKLTGLQACVESQKPEMSFDLNDDCTVNIFDLNLFVENWLACGIMPDCREL